MNNTIPNVPRELLADLLGNDHDKRIMAERNLLAMLANAPSPAGVDGLEVRAYEDSGGALYTAKLLEIMEVDSVGCEPLCRLSGAQAIIDGLRGEVADLLSMLATVSKACLRVRTERDQHAQRTGELEGLLLRTYEHAPTLLQCRIDAALSVGKVG